MTEVGVIPDDWEVRKIAIVSPLQRGFDLPTSDLEYGPYPVVYSNGVQNFHNFAIVKGPGVVTGRSGTIGIVNYINDDYWPHNTTLWVTDFLGNFPKFIYYLYSYIGFERFGTGSGVPTLNRNDVHEFNIALPQPTEQEAIAEALSDADTLIESLAQLIAKKRQIKQGTMQELLTGKKRLPGFSGVWEMKLLGELTEVISGGTPRTSVEAYWNGSIKWCTPTDITRCSGKYLYDTERSISEEGLSICSAQLLPAGTLLLCSRATIGELKIASSDICTNQGFKSLVCNKEIDNEFLYYSLLTMKSKMLEKAIGSTFLEISKKDTESLAISCPPLPEQQAIAAILSDMDTETEALESKLSKARAIKQGMMQELLTGRIRLVRPASNVIPISAKKETTQTEKKHNSQINEAVIIGVLANRFGSESYPLGRKRRTKLTYLLHRHIEGNAEGFIKKAAGPYNPAIKYKGPEGIAIKNGYVRTHNNGKLEGFVAADKVAQAEAYFEQWYGSEVLKWLERFRYKKNDELELLATVDMAMEDLRREEKAIELGTVKQIIQGHPEWTAKLQREVFSDANISRAIQECRELFEA